MATFRFEPYESTTDRPNVVVDGSPNAATVLTVSHWPGQPTPPRCAADTSAQMVFRYLQRGADLHGNVDVVTNNHFDQDGLAGIYALTQPEAALGRRTQVEDLASAGDFGTCADRSSARLSMAVAALADPARSTLGTLPAGYDESCAALYRAALELLPGWLEDPNRCRRLWSEEDAELDAGLASIASGAVTIDERPDLDLAVVTLPPSARSSGHRFVGRSFTGIHPMALYQATGRSTILLIDPADGRHRLTDRYEGWVQYRSRPIRRRTDLRLLAERLTAADHGGATWTATPPSDLTPELHTVAAGPPSSLSHEQLVAVTVGHLGHSPPAWDPYSAG